MRGAEGAPMFPPARYPHLGAWLPGRTSLEAVSSRRARRLEEARFERVAVAARSTCPEAGEGRQTPRAPLSVLPAQGAGGLGKTWSAVDKSPRLALALPD